MESDLTGPLDEKASRVILDSVADGVFTVDENWRITSFNRAAERITGIPGAEAIGKPCCEVFKASICETRCALRRTMQTGRPVVNWAIYIVDAKGNRVPVTISTALLRDEKGKVIGGVETFRDLGLVEELRRELTAHHTFADIISKSHQMLGIFDILPQVADSDATVLIVGDTGSGKELIARAVHNLSPRKKKPLVVVNCGALPENLLESELFGYKAGAFTDARKDKPGRFALADGGTVFLDEIGDVSLSLQVRLLRFLQEKTFEPLGGTESVKADVRIVCATNKPLEELVDRGEFRQDLYYRVNVVKISLPPLKARKEDIPLLVDHFVYRFSRLRGKDINGVDHDALAVLMRYDYPGNIRELENVIEHAFVLCPGGMIRIEHLPEYLRPSDAALAGHGPHSLAELEIMHIRESLARHNNNRAATADELGINKSTLWRKMKKYGIDPERG